MPVTCTVAINPQIIYKLHICIIQLIFYEQKLDLCLSSDWNIVS